MDHPCVEKLTTVLRHGEDVFLLGLILQEVLQGFRTERTADRLNRRLEPFELIPLERRHYVAAARLRRRCLSHGVTPSTVDALIASAAIDHRCFLLTADDDFEHISEVTKLRLL